MIQDAKGILIRLKGEPVRRTLSIGERAVNEETRTVSVAFASDKPVEHWFGKLILTMDERSMRGERLRSGAPLLLDHDPRDQIGVVEKVSVRGGFARAEARFSRSAKAEEIFADVKDGIRRNVSVGFIIHEMHLESDDPEDGPVYRSDLWEPIEISLVSIPADISVGVGRSANNLKKEGKKNMTSHERYEDNFAEDQAAYNEIREFGRTLGGDDERTIVQYLRGAVRRNETPTLEGMRRALNAATPQTELLPVESPADYVERTGGYELARTVPRYGRLEGFSGRDADRRAYRFGQWLLGGPMGNRAARQWCERNGMALNRAAQQGGLNEKGGFLVPEEFGTDIVDLVEKYGVFRSHAKIVPMNSDSRTDPVIDGELSSEFVGELEEGAADQDLDFGMIRLVTKKHMILVPMSTEVSEDSAISIADTVATATARAFAKKEDECGFNGDATSTYGGIVGIREKLKSVDGTIANIAGLQVGTGNAYSELTLTDFEGVVGRLPDYADTGNAKWFVSRKFYFGTMVRLILSGTPTATEIEDARNRRFLGYPVVFSQVMPSTEANSQVCAIFGDLSLGARFGDRRAVTIAIDDSILFRKDALLLRATSRFDINVHGVGDTTEAGPIVGLITAAA